MTRLSKLRDKVQQAAREILPEAPAVYICLASELPERLRAGGALAYTGPYLDLALQTHLPIWQGRGVAIVVGDAELRGFIHDICVGRLAPPEPMLRREFLNMVSHELGHTVGGGWIPTDSEPAPDGGTVEASTAAWCAEPLPPVEIRPIPWLGHDATFLRPFLHVAHRLRKAVGLWFVPYLAVELYGLSPLYRYQAAISDEPERLAGVPLTEIPTIPPPPEFVQLWRADLRRWFLEIPAPTEHQTAALCDGVRMFPSFPKG